MNTKQPGKDFEPGDLNCHCSTALIEDLSNTDLGADLRMKTLLVVPSAFTSSETTAQPWRNWRFARQGNLGNGKFTADKASPPGHDPVSVRRLILGGAG